MHSITIKICLTILILAFMASASSFAGQATAGRTGKRVSPEDELWKSAGESFDKLEFKTARGLFKDFSSKYPNDKRRKDALYYKGLCEMKMGWDTQAMNTWEQLVKLEAIKKTRSKALLLSLQQMIQYCDLKGKKGEKEKLLKQLLRDFPDDPITVQVVVKSAHARLEVSDYAGAKALYEKVLTKLSDEDLKNLELAVMMSSKDSMNPRQMLNYANRTLEKDNVEQAIKLYKTFLKECSGSPLTAEAMTRLGWCYYLQEKYHKAEALWNEVIKKGSGRDKWVGQSRWHMIQLLAGPAGKPNKAIEFCEIQAKAFPDDPHGERALFSRAWLYWTQKKWVKARAAFDDLFAAYPENAIDPPVQVYVHECEEGIRKRGGRK